MVLAEDGPLASRLIAAGATVEVLPLSERTRNLRKDGLGSGLPPIGAIADTATYVFRLARRLRQINPDLVHTNTLKAGVYGSLAARLARLPVVWHVRDRIATDYLSRPAVLAIRAMIATIPNAVIANSEATRSTLWRTPANTCVVHSIVAAPAGDAASTPHRTDERFVVGMVGRIARWKGQDVFLRAFAQAFRDGTELAVIVGEAMFGDDEVRYGEELRALAGELGIADRVEFRGFRDDVWVELEAMDVLAHASLSAEPFGQVIVEAMLAGVPVVAAAGGGPSEIVTDGVDGLLYPAGDVDALALALERLRGDGVLRARFSEAGAVRAQNFSPRAAAGGVMALYNGVVADAVG